MRREKGRDTVSDRLRDIHREERRKGDTGNRKSEIKNKEFEIFLNLLSTGKINPKV